MIGKPVELGLATLFLSVKGSTGNIAEHVSGVTFT